MTNTPDRPNYALDQSAVRIRSYFEQEGVWGVDFIENPKLYRELESYCIGLELQRSGRGRDLMLFAPDGTAGYGARALTHRAVYGDKGIHPIGSEFQIKSIPHGIRQESILQNATGSAPEDRLLTQVEQDRILSLFTHGIFVTKGQDGRPCEYKLELETPKVVGDKNSDGTTSWYFVIPRRLLTGEIVVDISQMQDPKDRVKTTVHILEGKQSNRTQVVLGAGVCVDPITRNSRVRPYIIKSGQRAYSGNLPQLSIDTVGYLVSEVGHDDRPSRFNPYTKERPELKGWLCKDAKGSEILHQNANRALGVFEIFPDDSASVGLWARSLFSDIRTQERMSALFDNTHSEVINALSRAEGLINLKVEVDEDVGGEKVKKKYEFSVNYFTGHLLLINVQKSRRL
jgi:hypothetical protein